MLARVTHMHMERGISYNGLTILRCFCIHASSNISVMVEKTTRQERSSRLIEHAMPLMAAEWTMRGLRTMTSDNVATARHQVALVVATMYTQFMSVLQASEQARLVSWLWELQGWLLGRVGTTWFYLKANLRRGQQLEGDDTESFVLLPSIPCPHHKFVLWSRI